MDTKKNNHANEYVHFMAKINIHKNNDETKLQECTKQMTIMQIDLLN